MLNSQFFIVPEPILRKYFLYLCLFCLSNSQVFGQSDLDQRILTQEAQLEKVRIEEQVILQNLEKLKLERIREDLKKVGYPQHEQDSQIVHHTAMSLSYSEQHEQPRWVAHIITPEIISGNLSRTNDFREDPKVVTGTAITEDYWDSGWDRGHMAPSADFRWSKTAISESYMYSNMSPQHPDLNREKWASVENLIREVVIREKHQVYVVTGPILKKGLPALGTSGVSIPEQYFKVALDMNPDAPKAIGFIFNNNIAHYPIQYYAVSVDSIESLTGIDFFPNVMESYIESLESEFEFDDWVSELQKGEALPLDMEKLPRGYVNTIVAGEVHIDRDIGVCGKVVSTKFSERSEATFLNLDRKFPDQIFTLTIWKDARPNFSYQPEVYLLDKEVCFEGFVGMSRGTPTMNLTHEGQVKMLEEVLK